MHVRAACRIHSREPPRTASLPCRPRLQRQRRLALWSIMAQPAQGFVAVTPMRWPGGGGAQVGLGWGAPVFCSRCPPLRAGSCKLPSSWLCVQPPRTPLGTAAVPAGAGLLPSPGTLLATGAPGGATGLSTPTSRLPGGAGPTGTYKK